MNKLRCIRCTSTAPSASIVAASTPSPQPVLEALARFLNETSPIDLSRMSCFASIVGEADRADHLLDIWTTCRRYASSDIPEAEAWAEAGLELIADFRERMAALEAPFDPVQVRAHLAAILPQSTAWTGNRFDNLRTTRTHIPRTPQPKEAACQKF